MFIKRYPVTKSYIKRKLIELLICSFRSRISKNSENGFWDSGNMDEIMSNQVLASNCAKRVSVNPSCSQFLLLLRNRIRWHECGANLAVFVLPSADFNFNSSLGSVIFIFSFDAKISISQATIGFNRSPKVINGFNIWIGEVWWNVFHSVQTTEPNLCIAFRCI